MPATNDREIEAKFLVADLALLAERLRAAGAQPQGERVFESNLRFDTPSGQLRSAKSALRLRQDTRSRVTFKGPPESGSEANERLEIEFAVSDFAAVRRLFEALGYQVFAIYEKYRTTWAWDGLEVVLDELPIGSFVEIEGGDAAQVRAAAEKLGLDWSARISTSYLELFEQLRSAGYPSRELSFAACEGIPADLAKIGLRRAGG